MFTSPPLAETVEALGPVSLRRRIRASNPDHDVFPRLCDVQRRAPDQAPGIWLVPTDLQIVHDANAPCALMLFAVSCG